MHELHSKEKIRHCPFCHSQDGWAFEIDTQAWAVSCKNCGAIGPRAESEQDALKKWGQREPQPA